MDQLQTKASKLKKHPFHLLSGVHVAGCCSPMLRLFHPVPPPRTRRAAQILCVSKTTNKPKYIANQQRNTHPLSRATHTKLKSLPTSPSQAPHSPRQPLTRLACIPLSPLPHPSLPPSPPFSHSINPNYPIIDDRNTTTITTTTIIDDMDSSADSASDKSWDRRCGTSKKVAEVNVDGGKRGSVVVKPRDELAATADGSPPAPATSPCGACKFLRRKCVSGCVFAPYFGSDQGAARFAAVHKVFGASNVSKLLLHIPAHRRHDAVVTISYEAQARLSDPVYGCVSTILALQQQVLAISPWPEFSQTVVMSMKFHPFDLMVGSTLIGVIMILSGLD